MTAAKSERGSKLLTGTGKGERYSEPDPPLGYVGTVDEEVVRGYQVGSLARALVAAPSVILG